MSADAPEVGGGGEASEPSLGGAQQTGGSVRDLSQRLRDLADRLRDPDLPDERAAELAREAAELVSRAGNEIDRALAESPDEG